MIVHFCATYFFRGNTTASSCSFYNWNYTYLAELGYKEAMNYISHSPKPNLTACKKYSYDEPSPKSSIVSEVVIYKILSY